MFKLKPFARNKLNVTHNIKFVFHLVENIAGKGENAGHQHFLFYPQFFKNTFSTRDVESHHCAEKGK